MPSVTGPPPVTGPQSVTDLPPVTGLPSVTGLEARRLAVQMVEGVLRARHPLDEARLAQGGDAQALPAREKALARRIALTTLRRLGQIDAILKTFMSKPLPRRAGPAETILQCAVAQILFLPVADHAAVNTATALAAQSQAAPFKGVVNGVLRRCVREGSALAAAQDAARMNTPAWLLKSWQAAHGEETALAVAQAHLKTPPLDLSLLTDDAVSWRDRLKGELLPGGSVRLMRPGAVTSLEGYEDGAWWVQDVAAAVPVKMLAAAPGEAVLDLCAAPGGKSAQLAAAGAQVTAVDSSPLRLGRLNDNMARLKLSVEVVEADVCLWIPGRTWDRVLLDAPCSATGTLRRHPDVAHLRRPEDMARLTDLQDRLLDAAARLTAPGGRLVYCVCTLQEEECLGRVAAFLARHGDFSREPVDSAGLDGHQVSAAGDLRTLPCHWADQGGMDGFYAARLVRRA